MSYFELIDFEVWEEKFWFSHQHHWPKPGCKFSFHFFFFFWISVFLFEVFLSDLRARLESFHPSYYRVMYYSLSENKVVATMCWYCRVADRSRQARHFRVSPATYIALSNRVQTFDTSCHVLTKLSPRFRLLLFARKTKLPLNVESNFIA